MPRTLGFLLVFFGLLPLDLVKADIARKDLVVPLGKLLCKGEISPQLLWAEGVFDGQIEGNQVESPSFVNLNESDLWKQAKSLAAIRRTGGYAAGLCNQHRGWTAAMPATSPVGFDKKGMLSFPKTDLQERCRKWGVHFSASEGGVSRVLAASDSSGNVPRIDGLPQGVVSINCTPKYPRWAGEQAWSFYPTKDPTLFVDFPGKADLKQGAFAVEELQRDLLSWINGIRIREKLDPMVMSPELSLAASQLLVSDSIDHDVTHMEEIRKKLSTPALKLEGENRVRGQTLVAMAWLLWNSPRHRDLLLKVSPADQKSAGNPVIGIAAKKIGAETLVSLVVGHKKQLPLSQKSAPNKKNPAHRVQ